MLFLTGFFFNVVSAIAQKLKLVKSNTGNLEEYFIWNNRIESCKRNRIIAIRH